MVNLSLHLGYRFLVPGCCLRRHYNFFLMGKIIAYHFFLGRSLVDNFCACYADYCLGCNYLYHRRIHQRYSYLRAGYKCCKEHRSGCKFGGSFVHRNLASSSIFLRGFFNMADRGLLLLYLMYSILIWNSTKRLREEPKGGTNNSSFCTSTFLKSAR